MAGGRTGTGNSPGANFAVINGYLDSVDELLGEVGSFIQTLASLNQSLGAEIGQRQGAVAAEAQARAQAVANAAQVWAQALATESTQRQEGVAQARADLGNAVAAETQARRDAITESADSIISQLGQQITALSTALNRAVSKEQNDRKDALDGLAQRLGQSLTALQNQLGQLADQLADQLAILTADTVTQEQFAANNAAVARALSDAAARAAADTLAVRDVLDERRYEFLGNAWRPGDAPLRFSVAASVAALGGPRDVLPVLPPSAVANGDSGAVYRAVGATLLATRNAFAVELGRLYRLRYVVQRRANPSDPNGDAVLCGFACLDQSLRVVGGVKTVKLYPSLVAALGRQECEALVSRTATLGGPISLPDATRFVVPVVQTFGVDALTDVEVLQWEDVTSAFVLAPLDASINERLATLESLALGDRVTELEQRVGNPSKMTFENVSFARGATIPANVQVVELLGWQYAGDGGNGLFMRTAADPEGDQDSFTSQGALFIRVQPVAAVAAQAIAAGFETYVKQLPGEPPPAAGKAWGNAGVPTLTEAGA